jgi:hypothetical protein
MIPIYGHGVLVTTARLTRSRLPRIDVERRKWEHWYKSPAGQAYWAHWEEWLKRPAQQPSTTMKYYGVPYEPEYQQQQSPTNWAQIEAWGVAVGCCAVGVGLLYLGALIELGTLGGGTLAAVGVGAVGAGFLYGAFYAGAYDYNNGPRATPGGAAQHAVEGVKDGIEEAWNLLQETGEWIPINSVVL